jgi:hypothetical protein
MGHSGEDVAAAGALPPEGVAGSSERNAKVGPQAELVRSAFLIGAGVFATTLAQPAVIKLPLQNLYRSTTAALFIEGGAGLFATLAEVPLMDLAARATPRGSESLGFAVMMSVRNGALALSDIVGSLLIDQYHVSFFSLVWLNAGTTAVVLLVIPFLPRMLMNRRDGEAAAH